MSNRLTNDADDSVMLLADTIAAVREDGRQRDVRCPAHEDGRASLSIGQGRDGRVLLRCHAGCSYSAIVEAAGLDAAMLRPVSRNPIQTTTNYQLRDATGAIVAVHRRVDTPAGKRVTWHLLDGTPGLGGRKTRDLPLYGVHRMAEWPTDASIIVCEGEKAADALIRRGIPALGTVTGASGLPSDAVLGVLAGRRVVLWPDADVPGDAHMARIGARLLALGVPDVRRVVWPDAPAGGDAADFNGDLAALLASAVPTSPLYTLTSEAAAVAPVEAVGDRPMLTKVSTVRREAVDWIWRHRFAKGKLVIVGGEPGEGKSTMLLDIAARCTRGDRWPDGGHAPLGSVLLLSAEDGLADTIAPRLDAAGADDARVHVLTAVQTIDGSTRGLDLARDLPQLEAALAQVRPVFVVIDPISAYLPKIDSWRDNDVRSVLAPLAGLAEKYACVVVAVMHLTKNAGTKILHRLLGSVGFVAAARVVLAVATDPDDAGRRLLLPVKNNLAPPADVLAFTRDDAGRIVWELGPVMGVTADSVMTASATDPHERHDAEQFLRDVLAGPEPLLAGDVFAAARKNGITDISLKRAKSRLGVRSRLVGFGKDGRWFWSLPASSEPAASAPESINPPEGITQKVSLSEPLCEPQRVSEGIKSLSETLSQNTKKTLREVEGINRDERGAHDARRY